MEDERFVPMPPEAISWPPAILLGATMSGAMLFMWGEAIVFMEFDCIIIRGALVVIMEPEDGAIMGVSSARTMSGRVKAAMANDSLILVIVFIGFFMVSFDVGG